MSGDIRALILHVAGNADGENKSGEESDVLLPVLFFYEFPGYGNRGNYEPHETAKGDFCVIVDEVGYDFRCDDDGRQYANG